MIATTIETTLHKCQRRQANLGAASTARARHPMRLIVLSAASGAQPSALPDPLHVLTYQLVDDLGQASWEDAEWR